MRLPNGYGSVAKLSGTRRKPFIVKKTVGWNEKGHPIYDIIGYTDSRENGLILLAEYNNDPWDIDAHKMTFQDVYNLWMEKKFPKLGRSTQNALRTSYKHCKQLYNMKYRNIRTYHMQDCIDNCGKGYSTQGAIKNLFGHLDNFALEIDVINKSYAQLTHAAPIPETTKDRFTDEEINKIWDLYEVDHDVWIGTILIFLYSGFRISELLGMKTKDIDFNEMIFTGGVKTSSGKNRIVPIHSLIVDVVKDIYNEDNTYFISNKGRKLSKNEYYNIYYGILEKAGFRKTPHEARHTFRSLLDSAGANKKCIDLMMGHKSKDVGLRRYTHKTLDELREAIELIKR